MINRRRALRVAVHVALAALPAAWLLRASGAFADQAFERFLPFLVDLDGWQGKKPQGFAMEMTGSNLITASRDYERGPARLQAQVMTGAAAQGALAPTRTAMNIETSDGRMNTSTIDGVQVTRSFNIKEQSGAILVALGTSALLSVTFRGIGDDDALALAKKFNWKALQAAIAQK
jgi:hypothetical protein